MHKIVQKSIQPIDFKILFLPLHPAKCVLVVF
jgi:hypothetical protein